MKVQLDAVYLETSIGIEMIYAPAEINPCRPNEKYLCRLYCRQQAAW